MPLNANDIGRRIAEARLAAALTQAQLAERVQMPRSAIAKVESGAQRVSAVQLANLADVLDRRIEWFLSDGPEAVVSRRSAHADGGERIVDREIERVAREVEFVVDQHGPFSPADLEDLSRPRNRAATESAAGTARELLGLDEVEPADDLSALVDRVGLLAFSFELGEDTADGACIHIRGGGVAIVNGSRQVGRRRLTLAHELGHYLFADEYAVDWRVSESSSGSNEARIDHFARAVLLPPDGTLRAWRDFLAANGSEREAAVRTASLYRVDMSTLALRLLELGEIDTGRATTVRSARTTRADFLDFALINSNELASPQLPRRYEQAVLDLYRGDVVSSARALDLLFDTWDEEDLPEPTRLPEQAIWSFVS